MNRYTNSIQVLEEEEEVLEERLESAAVQLLNQLMPQEIRDPQNLLITAQIVFHSKSTSKNQLIEILNLITQVFSQKVSRIESQKVPHFYSKISQILTKDSNTLKVQSAQFYRYSHSHSGKTQYPFDTINHTCHFSP